MLYGTAAVGNIPAVSYATRGYVASKLAFPVSSASYIYSHFEHVVGVPATEGARGVSINKLKILDVLIDQLSQLKRKSEPSFGAAGSLSEDRIDALIDQYEKEIRGARAASAAMPYLPKPSAPTGVVFDLVA